MEHKLTTLYFTILCAIVRVEVRKSNISGAHWHLERKCMLILHTAYHTWSSRWIVKNYGIEWICVKITTKTAAAAALFLSFFPFFVFVFHMFSAYLQLGGCTAPHFHTQKNTLANTLCAHGISVRHKCDSNSIQSILFHVPPTHTQLRCDDNVIQSKE